MTQTPAARIREWVEERKALEDKASKGFWFREKGVVFMLSIPYGEQIPIAGFCSVPNSEFISDARNSAAKYHELVTVMMESLEFYAERKVKDCDESDKVQLQINEANELLLSMDNGRKARDALEKCAEILGSE